MNDFLEMTAALGKRPQPLDAEAVAMNRVTVLGGGPDARAMAAMCLAEGADVTLFTAYGSEMEPLKKAGAVTIRGEGPVGSYQTGDGPNAIHLTAELDRAVKDADAIFVTGPVLKQRTYAMVLAGHLRDGQTLVLVNARSMGALETAWYLRAGGETAKAAIVELQGAPAWTRAEGATLHITRPPVVYAGALPAGRGNHLTALSRFVPGLKPLQNAVQSGFHDGSGLVETVALMHGGPALPDGGPSLPPGAAPLPDRAVFRKLIGAKHADLIHGLAGERRETAAKWGVRDCPSTEDWIAQYAGSEAGAGARPLPSQAEAHALIRCAVIGSLAPLASAARIAGVDAPLTNAMIATAVALLGGDLLHAGRSLETLGIGGGLDAARRAVDRIAGGEV